MLSKHTVKINTGKLTRLLLVTNILVRRCWKIVFPDHVKGQSCKALRCSYAKTELIAVLASFLIFLNFIMIIYWRASWISILIKEIILIINEEPFFLLSKMSIKISSKALVSMSLIFPEKYHISQVSFIWLRDKDNCIPWQPWYLILPLRAERSSWKSL